MPPFPSAADDEQPIVGKNGYRLTEIKAGIKADTRTVVTLREEFERLAKALKAVGDEYDRVATNSAKAKDASTTGGTAGTRSAMGVPQMPSPAAGSTSEGIAGPVDSTTTWGRMRAMFTGGGGTWGKGGIGGITGRGGAFGGLPPGGVKAAATVGGIGALGFQVGQAALQRVGTIAQYSLPADRMTMLAQMQTGQSQQQVVSGIRSPFTQFNNQDINASMQFMGQYGLMSGAYSRQIGRDIEGMSALTGYSISAQDYLANRNALASPEVANRMFRMTGVSIVKPGGGQRSMTDLFQQLDTRIGQYAGGTTEQGIRDAMALGSNSRAFLGNVAGLGEQQATDFLNYRLQNLQFQERGGIGKLDLSRESHRGIMGVTDNYAQQAEETETARLRKDELAYDRQKDNLAAMENLTEAIVDMKRAFEDFTSGPFGAFMGKAPIAAGFMGRASGITTGATMGAGIGMALGPHGAAAGALIGGIGGALLGDGPDSTSGAATGSTAGTIRGGVSSANDSQIMVPFSYSGNAPGGRIPLSEVKNKPTFKGMHPKMQERLLRLMRANPNVGIGQGLRSMSEQISLFFQRHVEDPNGDRVYNGKRYRLKQGAAPAAIPGHSFHGLGLAADLVGDIAWVNAHAAEFGLKHFAQVNGEPWHVQPQELPNGFQEYMKQGAPWGTPGSMITPPEDETTEGMAFANVNGSEHGSPQGFGGGVGNSPTIGGALFGGSSVSGGGGGAGFEGVVGSRASSSTGVAPSTEQGSTLTSAEQEGVMLAAKAAQRAGFRGEDLFKIIAIAGRESGYNPKAINRQSNDTGMWQIAPMNFGGFSQQQLLDAYNNATVAKRLHSTSGFHGWKAASSRKKNARGQWVVDPSGQGGAGWAMDGNELWHTEQYQPAARSAAAAVTSSAPATMGDPFAGTEGSSMSSSRGGGSVHVSSAPAEYNITVAPVIQLHSSGPINRQDLKGIAESVGDLIETKVREIAMRNN